MYEIFEKLLSKKGITAYRVAKETGITTATLTSWKQGKYTPKSEKLQKIADYFDVSIDYLTGNSFLYDLGPIIQEEREWQGISQEELAKSANISVAELDNYETLDLPIREDIADDIVASLGTTFLELRFNHGQYDDYIPSHFNGDVVKWEAFKKARDEDAMNENFYNNIARNDSERRLLMLCRKVGDASEEEKEALINQFEATIDIYLGAKGIKKE